MVIVAFFAIGFAATSCGGGAEKAEEAAETVKTEMSDKKADAKADMTEHKAEEKAEKDKTGKEYTSAYVCPMHCEGSGSAEPGKCPACGMDYVKNEDHEGHTH